MRYLILIGPGTLSAYRSEGAYARHYLLTPLDLSQRELTMIEHHIQREIIDRLSRARELRFSELKPDELESNSFMYHLKQLISGGWVEKTDKGYALAAAGLTYADGLSTTNSRPRKQAKILGVLVLKNKKGEYLLAKRKLQPFIDTLLFPGGKQHFGESPEDHVARELKEQFDLVGKPVRRGLIDQRSYTGETLISHIMAYVYELAYDGPPPPESAKFIYTWAKIDKSLQLYPGTYELFDALRSEKSLFFLSLDVSSD